ncbi:hypothetical protein GQ53DRAFT_151914 [Thozetella sp. PMI_491]|nr:hypothetical protein GQ53DRAFT_151914 [Thozetella sp. PMI_491]
MARKGSRKTRSGCITCKIRRVKCDESKPSCNRCIDSGRKCDGYLPTTWPRAHHILRPNVPTSYMEPLEGRAMAFFRTRAALSLSGLHDPRFWTSSVLQLSQSQSAVRHAIIALGSIYEDFTRRGKFIKQLQSNQFALRHYNMAIQHVQKENDAAIVVVVCIIFICIEFLQGDQEQGLIHTQHGINLLATAHITDSELKDQLAWIIQRLRMLPLLYQKAVQAPELHLDLTVPAEISSIDAAERLVNKLHIAVVKAMIAYRYASASGQPISDELLPFATLLQNHLSCLRLAYRALHQEESHTCVEDARKAYLIMQIEICELSCDRILPPQEEPLLEQHHDKFRSIVRMAERVRHMIRPHSETSSEPYFWLEPTYIRFLFALVTNCRDLAIRLRALDLMRDRSWGCEGLCDGKKMYQRARRLVEVEHGLVLNQNDNPVGPVAWDRVPSKENRVLQVIYNAGGFIRTKVNGETIIGAPESFLMSDSNGRLFLQTEFVLVDSDSGLGGTELVQLERSIRGPWKKAWERSSEELNAVYPSK